MSRSAATLTNPATRFLEWGGGAGELKYYDKQDKKNVTVTLPFSFQVLDDGLSTITGWSDQDQSGIWSNEVRSIQNDELVVRTKHGIKIAGKYQDIKGKFGKYTKSVYIAYKDDAGEYVIGNLKLTGAALGAWIELSKAHSGKLDRGTVGLVGNKEEKNGAVTYKVPVFKYRESTPEEDSAAVELDKELQVYLHQYFANSHRDDDHVSNDPIDDELGLATDAQLAEFEALKADKFNSINIDELGDFQS